MLMKTMYFILFFVVFVYLVYIISVKLLCSPNIKKICKINELDLETGDLVLVSSYQYLTKYQNKASNFIRLFGRSGEWNHVALIVKINGEPYVYDTCPYYEYWIEYDITSNKHKHSGYIRLSKYVESFDGYLGIRKLKSKYITDRSVLVDITKHHNENMEFSSDTVNLFTCPKPHIKETNYKYNCCEAVASIYNDAGIDYDKFHKYMIFGPFVDPHCPLFDDVIHIEPGPKLNKNIAKYFKQSE